jgi:hypothetical protein
MIGRRLKKKPKTQICAEIEMRMGEVEKDNKKVIRGYLQKGFAGYYISAHRVELEIERDKYGVPREREETNIKHFDAYLAVGFHRDCLGLE